MKSASNLLTPLRARGERPVALARFNDVTSSGARRSEALVELVEHGVMPRGRVRPNHGGARVRRQSRRRSSS